MTIPLFQPVLAADLGPIIQAIIFLVILASGVAKMFRESKEVQRRAERPARPQPPRRPPPAEGDDLLPRPDAVQPAQARQAPQEAIRSEVEEFLRRVGQDMEEDRQGQRRPQQARRSRQPQIEVFDQGSGFEVDPRPKQSRRKSQPKPKPSAPVNLDTEGIDLGEDVAEHVAQHMKQAEFVERAAHLGDDVAQADERMEARLHQTFDHGLGSLAARRQAREAADQAQKGQAANSQAAASDLLKLLSTPQGVQQAIIISEVLRRPADRW